MLVVCFMFAWVANSPPNLRLLASLLSGPPPLCVWQKISTSFNEKAFWDGKNTRTVTLKGREPIGEEKKIDQNFLCENSSRVINLAASSSWMTKLVKAYVRFPSHHHHPLALLIGNLFYSFIFLGQNFIEQLCSETTLLIQPSGKVRRTER